MTIHSVPSLMCPESKMEKNWIRDLYGEMEGRRGSQWEEKLQNMIHLNVTKENCLWDLYESASVLQEPQFPSYTNLMVLVVKPIILFNNKIMAITSLILATIQVFK